jgi:hypothetical protein
MEKVRRPSARSDGLGNVVSALDFVLPRKREVAGARRWRWHASGDHGDLDSLRNKIGERVREVCWAKARRLEVREEDLAHRRCQI